VGRPLKRRQRLTTQYKKDCQANWANRITYKFRLAALDDKADVFTELVDRFLKAPMEEGLSVRFHFGHTRQNPAEFALTPMYKFSPCTTTQRDIHAVCLALLLALAHDPTHHDYEPTIPTQAQQQATDADLAHELAAELVRPSLCVPPQWRSSPD